MYVCLYIVLRTFRRSLVSLFWPRVCFWWFLEAYKAVVQLLFLTLFTVRSNDIPDIFEFFLWFLIFLMVAGSLESNFQIISLFFKYVPSVSNGFWIISSAVSFSMVLDIVGAGLLNRHAQGHEASCEEVCHVFELTAQRLRGERLLRTRRSRYTLVVYMCVPMNNVAVKSNLRICIIHMFLLPPLTCSMCLWFWGMRASRNEPTHYKMYEKPKKLLNTSLETHWIN